MKNIYVKIDGIHCHNCEEKIKNKLLENKKIKQVKIDSSIAHITYSGKISNTSIIKMITDLGYITKDEYISDDLKTIDTNIKLKEFIIILGIMIFLMIGIKKLVGVNIFNLIPKIDHSVTYGMLVVMGFLTSIHCVSMCGSINLMTVSNLSGQRDLKKPILYNLGRVLSYTIIGGIAGLVGNVLAINSIVSGFIIIVAAMMMLGMSLGMLGFGKFRFPRLIKVSFKKTRNVFVIGLLNGLMPCGPLQTMQIYALSTGSFITGALSMFLFGIGTVPLMLFMGVVVNFVKGRGRILVNKISTVLMFILAVLMLNRGFLTLNIDILRQFHTKEDYKKAILKDKYQEIWFDLDYDHYEDIVLQKDIPVKMIIHIDKNKLTGCNNEIVMKEFGIDQKLKVGDNVIEFTPKKKGNYTYTCYMNMIKNNIKVIDDLK